MIKIALDAMGGDNAPHDVVHGGIEAARLSKGRFVVVFVGDEQIIKTEIARHFRTDELPLEVVHASQTIAMNESPSIAVKQKKDSSMAVAMRLHKEGSVDAMVSAGNTGALMATALFILKRMEYIRRPGIGSILPTETGRALLLDVGANVDCRPEDLLKFGIMGSTFYGHLFSDPRPRVALLNIGQEPMKGNELTIRAHKLLADGNLNFIGNIEGGDVLRGVADVVVCDGFVGNIVLKFGESLHGIFKSNLRILIGKKIISKVGALLMQPTFESFRKIFDYQEYGGAPFLGVQGACIKAHGKSSPRAIKNAILAADKMVSENVTQCIREELKKMAFIEDSEIK